MHHTAAAGAIALSDIDQHLIARQMRWEGSVVAVGGCLAPLALFVSRRVLRSTTWMKVSGIAIAA
jgi:hypothetical protein